MNNRDIAARGWEGAAAAVGAMRELDLTSCHHTLESGGEKFVIECRKVDDAEYEKACATDLLNVTPA